MHKVYLTLDIFDIEWNEQTLDVTDYLRAETLSFNKTLFGKEFRPTVDTCSFELRYGDWVNAVASTRSKIKLHIDDEADNPVFTGFCYPDYAIQIGEFAEPSPIRFEAEDNTYLLRKYLASSHNYPEQVGGTPYYICKNSNLTELLPGQFVSDGADRQSILHILLKDAGLIGADHQLGLDVVDGNGDPATIIHFAATKDVDVYLDIISKLLVEFGYTFYFDEGGNFVLYSWMYDSITEQYDVSNEFHVSKSLDVRRQTPSIDGVQVEYAITDTIDNALLYRVNTPFDSDGVYTGKPLLANTYLPPTGHLEDVWYEYRDQWLDIPYLNWTNKLENNEIQLIATSGQSLDESSDPEITYTTTFESKRAKVLAFNTSSTEIKRIYYLDIRGDALFRSSIGKVKSEILGSGSEVKIYTTSYIYDGTQAQRLCTHLANYYENSNTSISFSSSTLYPLGTVVRIENEHLPNAYICVVQSLSYNVDWEIYNYKVLPITIASTYNTVTYISGQPERTTNERAEAIAQAAQTAVEDVIDPSATTIPEPIVISTVRSDFQSVTIAFERQTNLSNLDYYEVAVSSSATGPWYEIASGGDWKGSQGETRHDSRVFNHYGIPLNGTAADPQPLTLYYRFRQKTKAGLFSAWTETGPVTIEPLDGDVIAADGIIGSKISAGTITANEIASNTITASKIASNTITANEIASNTITASEIASNTITANEIASSTITANEIDANTITANEIAASTITSDLMAADNFLFELAVGNQPRTTPVAGDIRSFMGKDPEGAQAVTDPDSITMQGFNGTAWETLFEVKEREDGSSIVDSEINGQFRARDSLSSGLGTVWVSKNTPLSYNFGTFNGTVFGIAASDTDVVVVGSRGELAYGNTDLTGFNQYTGSVFGSNRLNRVAQHNYTFLVGGQEGKVWRSTSVATWTLVNDGSMFTAAGTSDYVEAFHHDGSNWWVSGDDGILAISSNDGVTWTNRAPNNFWHYNGVDSFLGRVYIATENTSNQIYYTVDDGVNWTPAISGLPQGSGTKFNCLAAGAGSLVGGDSSNDFWYSLDGLNWTQSVFNGTFGTNTIVGVTHGDGVFFAYDINGLVYRSYDLGRTFQRYTNYIQSITIFSDPEDASYVAGDIKQIFYEPMQRRLFAGGAIKVDDGFAQLSATGAMAYSDFNESGSGIIRTGYHKSDLRQYSEFGTGLRIHQPKEWFDVGITDIGYGAGRWYDNTAVNFLNGWTNYGSGYNNAGFMKDSDGFVHLKGLIRNGTVGQTAFILPVGYRPSSRPLIGTITSSLNVGRIDIQTSGAVTMQNGSSSWISLDNIRFYVGND